jgi:hypothetical protein
MHSILVCQRKEVLVRNIILEGPDNAGKSTLAKFLRRAIQWPLKDREGKPPSRRSMIDKVERYLNIDGYIIDRHVVISQTIYGQALRDDLPIPFDLVSAFYAQPNLIIYCRCIDQGLEGHQPTMHEGGLADTVDHCVELERNYERLIQLYDEWAIRHAHIVYTRYDQMEWILSMVRGIINERRSVGA